MKKLTILFAVALSFLAAGSLSAQSKYGADSAECIKYLSFYQDYMKQGNLDEADPVWQKAISLCPPTASQNMLLDGMKILRKKINKYRSNPIRKETLVDSLMMLHEMRIQTYPRYIVTAKSNKAMDMMTYASKGKEQEVFNVLGDAMDTAKEKTAIVIPVRYMSYANDLYKAGSMSAEEVMAAYTKAYETAELIEKAKPSQAVTDAKKDIENLLMISGVASCENLIDMFTPRYEANPTDKYMLGNIVSMFSASNCLDADLFVKAVESLHKLEPSHNSAYLLYKLYSQRNQPDQAVAYMEEAISVCADTLSEQAADYLIEFATYCFKSAGKDAKAVEAAKKAAELNPAYQGKAYLLAGTIWGSQKCHGNEIETRAPYWVAVDFLTKAKNADETLTDEANNLISQYRKYFPLKSEAFMFDLLDGATYTVSCNGLRESTKVRTQD
jgi:tetratricopeptide (TPR) repeat protein